MCGKGDRNEASSAQVQKGPHHYQARNESSPEMIIISLHFTLGFSNFSVRINYLCTCSVTKLVTPELSIIAPTLWNAKSVITRFNYRVLLNLGVHESTFFNITLLVLLSFD